VVERCVLDGGREKEAVLIKAQPDVELEKKIYIYIYIYK